MQHAARVRERNGIANTQKKPQAVRHGRDRLDELVEAFPLHEFHGVKNAAIRECSHIVHRHDARMLESGQHARFAEQPVGEIAIRARDIEHFQRHATLEIFVFRGVHNSHTAARNAFEQTVARAGEIGRLRAVAQSFECGVRKESHFESQPKTARASRRNSSSVAQSSRKRSRAIFRNSRRAHASALVTSVTGIPNSFESCS